MPSYAQLQSEVWWANEFQPPALAELCRNLRGFFQVGAAALGSKGDNNHLYGYHRSRAWILSSGWSQYGAGDYSVQAAEDQGGDSNWLAAVDFTPGDADTMITVCQRLDAAVKAGKTPQLREWYGNVDGDQIVDGWDLLYDRAATSDSSHLWHLHMSFLRSKANDDHSNLFAILTGEDDMSQEAEIYALNASAVTFAMADGKDTADCRWAWTGDGHTIGDTFEQSLGGFWKRVNQAGAPSQDQVNAAVKAALQDPAVVAGIAKAVNDDAAARLAH